LDDSTTIIKWGAMENSAPTTENSTVASSVGSVKWSRDSVQNVLYAAVGMVSAIGQQKLWLRSRTLAHAV
jgi:hypothetical protein